MKTLLLALLLALLFAPFAHALTVTPVVNGSGVSISGRVGYLESASYSASQTAAIVSPFIASLSDSATVPIPYSRGSALASSDATQSSSYTGNRINASGTAGISVVRFDPEKPGGGLLYGSATADAASVFDLIFSLSESTAYSLSGYIERTFTEANITLSLLGGLTLIDFSEMLGHPSCPCSAPDGGFDLSGVLPPGTYRITGMAHAGAVADRFEISSKSASFDLSLNFAAAVPEAGATFAMLALGLAGLVAVPSRRK